MSETTNSTAVWAIGYSLSLNYQLSGVAGEGASGDMRLGGASTTHSAI